VADVEFFGDKYELNDDVSQFALLEFARAASEGQDGDTMEGLASLLRLVEECVAEKDRKRFLGSCRKNRASADDLTTVLQAAFEVKAERPTGRPAVSSDGPSSIEPKSDANSAVKASTLIGRPDLQLMVAQAG
jgi:hypothetical protein